LNILLTGGGAPGAAGIIKCLRNGNKKIRIVCVDINPNAYGKVLADVFYSVPVPENTEYIMVILSICEKESIDVIIPLVTRELPVFSAEKTTFSAKGINVCVLDKDILSLANNKYLLLSELAAKKISVPRYSLCNNIDQFETQSKCLDYPNQDICFKPTISNGSRGFRVISSNFDEFKNLFSEKPNNVYISYQTAFDLFSKHDFPPLIIMEYLSGEEYSVDCLVNNGTVLYCIPRLRNRMNGGISIDATVIRNEAVINLATKICEKLRLHGNIGIQFKFDKNNNPQILEINPRLQGSIVLCAAAGVNLPYYGVLLATNSKVPIVPVNWGIRMCRYWEEVYFDKDGQSFTYNLF
jgi:carbamoyl-phosphate synthase large subunit